MNNVWPLCEIRHFCYCNVAEFVHQVATWSKNTLYGVIWLQSPSNCLPVVNKTKELRIVLHKNFKLPHIAIQQCDCVSLQVFGIRQFQWRRVQMKWTLVPALQFIVCFRFSRIPPLYYGCIWLNPGFCYCVHKGPPLASVLIAASINTLAFFLSHFLQIFCTPLLVLTTALPV